MASQIIWESVGIRRNSVSDFTYSEMLNKPLVHQTPDCPVVDLSNQTKYGVIFGEGVATHSFDFQPNATDHVGI